jgi:hypothetical protein
VFGVSSDEFLNYATQNREEWASKGESIVAEMAARVIAKVSGDDTLVSSRHLRNDD